MNAGQAVRRARRRAGITQRRLASATGIAQPTVARIEVGTETPRLDTFSRLLSACGMTIAVVPNTGQGIDRTEIRALLKLTPAERLRTLRDEATTLDRLTSARRVR
jgi:predicted transcriptional regulator